MHELSLCRNIVAIVSEAAAGRRIRRVTLELGQLAGVMGDALAFCFPIVAQGTGLDGAVLELQEVPGRVRCTDCAAAFDAPTLTPVCRCGSRGVTWLAGQELNIKSMELEEAA